MNICGNTKSLHNQVMGNVSLMENLALISLEFWQLPNWLVGTTQSDSQCLPTYPTGETTDDWHHTDPLLGRRIPSTYIYSSWSPYLWSGAQIRRPLLISQFQTGGVPPAPKILSVVPFSRSQGWTQGPSLTIGPCQTPPFCPRYSRKLLPQRPSQWKQPASKIPVRFFILP